MIALENELLDYFIKIFIKKESVEINENIKNFLKYLRIPVVVSVYQNEIFSNPVVAKQQRGFFKLIKEREIDKLYKKTTLKLILSLSKKDYPYININDDEFESNFTATYSINSNKLKLYEHIKNLIQYGDKIEIFDKYLLFDNGDKIHTDNDHYSIKFLKNILIGCKREFIIYCKNNDRNSYQNGRIYNRKEYLNNSINYDIKFNHNFLNEHDRYIKIYNNNKLKYEIILSSGVFNILNPNKDITYIIRIIN